ncbi:MAG: UDP-N-acetylmuramoyl-tripeptide--D-alanyl-D-alanine ligase [Clostridia bacterium]|nr:UDP-N-acetylmuramoyl-tripeptide--D-alanyl-D-alanine ligase [Clostridia bacterium]
MKALKIADIIEATHGTLLCGDEKKEITNVLTDSRKIEDGCLFVALTGENFDGHDFLESAFNKGAIAAVVSKDVVIEDKTIIKVPNTLKALGHIAGLYREKFNIPALAITGSVGKTSTKEMCAAVLSQKFNVHKNQGNFNNEIGVPYTIFGLAESHDMLVCEMGMSGFGEIDSLSQMIKPDVSIMTNIGISHIELLGSQENIFKAKSEFVKNMKKGGTVIINGDDPILYSHKDELGDNVLTYGIKNEKADLVARNVEVRNDGISFKMEGFGKKLDIALSVLGEHNVYNALAACCLAKVFDIDDEKVKNALKEHTPHDMRLCVIPCENFTIINDCYNAAPDSMRAALKVLSSREGRKVAVLGDMAALGEFSKEAHTIVGEEVVNNGIDVLITIGSEAKTIAKSAKDNGMVKENIYSFETTKELIENIDNIITSGATILVKASRVMKLEEVTEYLKTR